MDGAMAQQLADNIVTISKVSSSPASAGSHLNEDEAMDGAMAQQLADNVATIIDLTQSFGSDAKDDLSALKAAGKLSSRLRHQLGNATAHFTAEQKERLEQVLILLNTSAIESLDQDTAKLQKEIDDTINLVRACNTKIQNRQAEGDLGIMHAKAITHQTNFTDLQAKQNSQTEKNKTAWSKLKKHMLSISDPFPENITKANFDKFFGSD